MKVNTRSALCLLAVLISCNVTASNTKSAQIDLIIGGANTRSLAGNPMEIKFGIGYDLEPLVNCGKSDLSDIVKASFDTGQFKYIQTQLIQMLYTSLDLGSLAGSIIRRMYPDEYDSIMSGIAEAKLSWLNAMTQCGAVQDAVLDATIGGDLTKQSKAYSWAEFSNSASAGNFNFAEDWMSITGSSNGVNIGGIQKGGDSQQPINIPSDITKQSYSKYASVSNSNPESNQRVSTYFASEGDLNTFITDLVGSKELRVCENCDPVTSTAGVGIKPFLKKEKKRVKTELVKVMNLSQAEFTGLTNADLENISPNSKIRVDTFLIQSLKMLPDYKQDPYLDSLADEISMANVMEKTLAARRILKTGMNEGSIARSEGVVKVTQETLDSMDYELNELERELRMSKLLSNSTSSAILMQRAMQENRGINAPTGVIQ